ncbi:MAG: ATP synthase F1 subunit epsilon [Puniceicoccales bacterium]|jgi:F-type H+-transporting ATPase subunit epsilon|nr:ATP synthase F1 subunit epsilon [Puniceicoccales bacterium]
MPLTIEIVTPARKVFSSAADSVVLPAKSGQLGILPGHIPLVVLLNPGEVVVTHGAKTEQIVVDQGFARVLGDVVSILTEAAIDTDDIDLDAVSKAEAEAIAAIAEARDSKGGEEQEAELERLAQILRFSAAQKLYRPGAR